MASSKAVFILPEQSIPTSSRHFLQPGPIIDDSKERVEHAPLSSIHTTTTTGPELEGFDRNTHPTAHGRTFERQLGNSEVSYFLPSRGEGVNDMYLHLGLNGNPEFVTKGRFVAVWAIMRIRHPLLASNVEMRDYDDIRFVYTLPQSAEVALNDAEASFEYRTQDKDELIDSYLNGPRTLSSSRLAYLVLSDPHGYESLSPPESPKDFLFGEDGATEISEHDIPPGRQFEVLICAAHCIGDGMALHNFANEFFKLLGTTKTTEDLVQMLIDEWWLEYERVEASSPIPLAAETRIPQPRGKLKKLAAVVDFQTNESKFIGGHAFPKERKCTLHTIVTTVSFDENTTKQILKRCKAKGVSISNALFAACNIAWSKMSNNPHVPMMMYSALNLRPFLTPSDISQRPHCPPSYWFLAVGYFNIVLPTFLPSQSDHKALVSTFWLRARSAKEQGTRVVKSPMLKSRVHEMSAVRATRSKAWAREDDEREYRLLTPPLTPPMETPTASAGDEFKPDTQEYNSVDANNGSQPSPSAVALMGLSLLGNLDGIYEHAAFPDLKLTTLGTGSRQRPGGMLLFGYTFAGRLWLSLGYDELGFKAGVVDTFWVGLQNAVDALLIAD